MNKALAFSDPETKSRDELIAMVYDLQGRCEDLIADHLQAWIEVGEARHDAA